MTGRVSIPVSPELRKEDTKPINGLKKIVTKWKWLTAVITVLDVIVAGLLFVMYATNKIIYISYDGKNFTLEYIDDKYCVVYHGEGSFGSRTFGDLDTGVYTVEFSTTLLEKILAPVKPVYRKIFNVKEYDYIPLCNRGEITKLVTKEGKVIWQAGEEEIKEFERTKPSSGHLG